MTGRAAMTGNVTRIRRATMTRNPITPVVVKVKVRRQLSCRFFPAPFVVIRKCEDKWVVAFFLVIVGRRRKEGKAVLSADFLRRN